MLLLKSLKNIICILHHVNADFEYFKDVNDFSSKCNNKCSLSMKYTETFINIYLRLA